MNVGDPPTPARAIEQTPIGQPATPSQKPPDPLVIGLTGGTGVGKTTVADLLKHHGAIVVDCDQLGRDVVAPGSPVLTTIFGAFGDEVRAPDGGLDRAALASIVFTDSGALDQLNSITHPAIDDLIAQAIDDARSSAGSPVVVLDMAVLVESSLGAGQYHKVVVVEAPLDDRLQRLGHRGMTADDARARIASQASDAERRAIADYLVENDADFDHLRRAVNALWAEVELWQRQR